MTRFAGGNTSHWYVQQWMATESLPTNAVFNTQCVTIDSHFFCGVFMIDATSRGNCTLAVPEWFVESSNARICRYGPQHQYAVELHQVGQPWLFNVN